MHFITIYYLTNQANLHRKKTLKYYQNEDNFALHKAKTHINATLERALEETIISEEE